MSAETLAAPRATVPELRESLIGLDGVHCAACVARVQRSLAGEVESCEIDLASRIARVRHDPRRLTLRQLIKRLTAEGFQPRALAMDEAENDPARDARIRRRALGRIGVAVIGAMQVMMFAWPGYFDDIPDAGIDELLRMAQLLVATPVVLWAGWPFFEQSVRALAARNLTMDVPVAASLVIAFTASAWRTFAGEGQLYFDAATMFVALLLAGRYLEAATRAKASERLHRLAQAAPVMAQRLHGQIMEIVPITQLTQGDRVRVLPGEALPVDGTLEDVAELDEALLTGESRPVLRKVGEFAMAGSLNLSQRPLVMRTVAAGAGTRVAGILGLLQRAAAVKPRVQHVADRVAAHFTLAVLLLAALGGVLAIPNGADAVIGVVISVMVASCPCALSLAVPAALAAATSRLAARGVLVARADRLLRLADVDTVLMDKTGTLTHASLQVQRVQPLYDVDAAQALRIAATLEAGLPHPIAQAFAGMGDGVIAEKLRVEPGRGVEGCLDGRNFRLGPAALDVAAQDPALTWVSLSDENKTLAHFGLSSAPRAEAAAVVRALQDQQLHVALLTGDSHVAALHAARVAGIGNIAARQSPDDKLEHLRALQQRGRVVLAVGDGLNDAPFLAAADVSAAMPKGATVTQARADLLLVNDRLDGLLLARSVARQARQRVRENLLWAVTYNLAVLPIAFLGDLPPALAAAGMSLSSLLVVANALRLRLPEPS